MNVQAYCSTHVGRRPNNEDAYRVESALGLFLVADGMGGYEGGEVASRLVVDTIANFFGRAAEEHTLEFDRRSGMASEAENMMGLAIRLANREVAQRRVGRLAQMGSTLAALLLRDTRALIAHVGDSRVYRARDGEIECLTRDHSLYAALQASGVPGQPGRDRYAYSGVITRAVGVTGHSDPDIRIDEVMPGDRLLLCTDGVTDSLSNEDIGDILSAMKPHHAVDALIAEAYAAGSQDNLTAMLIALS